MHATTADSPGVAGLKYALGRSRLQNSGKSSEGIPSFSPPSLHQLLSSDSLQANLLRKCKFPSHWELFYTYFLHKEQPHPCVRKLFLKACLPDTYNAMEMPPPGTDGHPLQVGCSVFKLPFYVPSTSISYIKPYMGEFMIICPYDGQVQYSAIFAISPCLSF